MVCVSHSTGSGGDEVAKRVATQLGFLYVDEDIVARAAAEGGLEPRDVADEELRQSVAMRMLEVVAEGGQNAWMAGGAVPLSVERLPSSAVRALIRETVVQTAGRGDVVICAHAASYAVERGPRTLRVLVTASPAARAQRLAATGGVDQAQAARLIKESDAGRRDYLKRFYAVSRESPTDYDLVINTDVFSTDQAAQIVVHAAA